MEQEASETKTKESKNTIFKIISKGNPLMSTIDIINILKRNGFTKETPHWNAIFENLMKFDLIDEESFKSIFKNRLIDISRIIGKNMIIPDFQEFCDEINKIFEESKKDCSGNVASYIPQLSKVNPNYYGLGLCTIDGQRYDIGDSSVDFCIQSCSNPINYAIALEALGKEYVHFFVDKEPSGETFNSYSLNYKNIPFNPLINAGAIVICSLIDKNLNISEKFENIMQWYKRLSGGFKIGFSNAIYLSERNSADRNFSIAHLMKSKGTLSQDCNIKDSLEFYFQCCSIELNCKTLSIIAATLANGGVCPITHERVFSTDTTKSVLSLMFSCGMNDYSGQFAFSVGVPAKSGVSGAIMVVIPGICGFALFSPRLDKYSNSARGLTFCKNLVNKFNFHNFDISNQNKKDPVLNRSFKQQKITSFIWACRENDFHTVRLMVLNGFNVNSTDFDRRSGLHLAAGEGHYNIVQFLLENGADPKILDRWNNTALDDAIHNKRTELIELMKKFSIN
jgi:glutaminase